MQSTGESPRMPHGCELARANSNVFCDPNMRAGRPARHSAVAAAAGDVRPAPVPGASASPSSRAHPSVSHWCDNGMLRRASRAGSIRSESDSLLLVGGGRGVRCGERRLAKNRDLSRTREGGGARRGRMCVCECVVGPPPPRSVLLVLSESGRAVARARRALETTSGTTEGRKRGGGRRAAAAAADALPRDHHTHVRTSLGGGVLLRVGVCARVGLVRRCLFSPSLALDFSRSSLSLVCGVVSCWRRVSSRRCGLRRCSLRSRSPATDGGPPHAATPTAATNTNVAKQFDRLDRKHKKRENKGRKKKQEAT